jgi:hypothetical protein
MATKKTFAEFMAICEAVSQSDARLARSGVISRHADALQREIDDVTSGRKKQKPTTTKRKVTKISFIDRSNAKLREESEIDEKFSMAADTSKPQSPKPTQLPKSRERNVGKHDDWKDKPTEWGERPPAGKKLKSRLNAVVGTQQRQDVETGVRKEEAQLDEVVITRSPEVKQRAKNIKQIRNKKEVLAALMKHAELQKQGLADEVEYDGESVDEVLMITPATKKPTKKVVKSITKLKKPDPSDPDYVEKYRAWIESRKQSEMVDYVRLSSGAERATAKAAAAKQAKRERQQGDAEAARRAFRTKGIPFSDRQGSGHIVNGKKVYAS